MSSPISSIAFEGIKLKRSMRILLKQLGLAYAVKEGMLLITSEESPELPWLASKPKVNKGIQ
jgi:hypothetical protein